MDQIEKLMTVTPAEFAQAWRAFAVTEPPSPGAPVRLPLVAGEVEISFEPCAPVRLGGLLTLPRAVVGFVFSGVTPEHRADLVGRFDRAFQRGGG